MVILKKNIKLLLSVWLLFSSLQAADSQSLVKLRSTLSSAGSSESLMINSHRYYFQQSIGQSGVIGMSQSGSYLLRQGFLQPLGVSNEDRTLENLKGEIFPNPFSSNLTVSFDEDISDIMYVAIYDLSGRIVFLKKYGAAQELSLNVSYLTRGIYIIRVSTTTKWLSSKMIKR